MMPNAAQPNNPSAPFALPEPRLFAYREALQRLLVANGIAVGTPDAVSVLAEALRCRPQLRVRLLSFLEGLLRREAEPVGALELLGFLASTARGTAINLDTRAMRVPLGDLLAFVLEAEQGRPEADGTRGTSVRRPRVHLRPRAARRGDAGEGEFENFENVEGSTSGVANTVWPVRRAHLAVALFCLMIGLVAGLLSRGHRPLPGAPTTEQVARGTALPELGAADPVAPTPDVAVTTRAIFGPAASRVRDQVEVRGSRRIARRRITEVARVRGDVTSASRKVAAVTAGAGRPVASRTAVARKRGLLAAVAASSAPGKPLGSSPPASLQPASFRPLGRGAEREAIAKALLRGTDGDGSRNLLSGAAGLHPSVVAGSAGIMAANVLASPAPAYPGQASALHVQGEVVIQAVVGRDGRIVETRVVSGPQLLQAAALEAVGRWSYRPYVVNGKAAEITTTAIVDFRLGR